MKIWMVMSLLPGLLLPAVIYAQANGSGQKIVIMDSGVARDDFFKNRVFDQWCWSQPTQDNVGHWSEGSRNYGERSKISGHQQYIL